VTYSASASVTDIQSSSSTDETICGSRIPERR
jgi:hypothetical protein